MIELKRAYDPAEKTDGRRILVDRLWPRGVTKERANIDQWMKELAPSTELRKWFGHDPSKWREFQTRYRAELKEHKKELSLLAEEAKKGKLTLIYSAKDEDHNDALVLKSAIEKLS